jgi:hypothetical protein
VLIVEWLRKVRVEAPKRRATQRAKVMMRKKRNQKILMMPNSNINSKPELTTMAKILNQRSLILNQHQSQLEMITILVKRKKPKRKRRKQASHKKTRKKFKKVL